MGLRAEYADMRAGGRYCAASSEHRVNTTEKNTVNTVEYGRVRLNPCPLERQLGYKSPYSASRVVCLVHHHADNPPPVCHAKPEAGAQESRAVKAVSRGVLAPRYEACE